MKNPLVMSLVILASVAQAQNSCVEKLIYSEAGQVNGAWIPPVNGSSQGCWTYERYSYILAINEAVACLTAPCEKPKTLPILEQSFAPKVKVTKTSTASLKAGLIPLFTLLIGTNAEYSNTTTTTTETTQTARAGGVVLSSGSRLTQYWATHHSRERETRYADGDLATRNRTTKSEYCAVVGGLDGTPRSYDQCTNTWTGPSCPPVLACPETPAND